MVQRATAAKGKGKGDGFAEDSAESQAIEVSKRYLALVEDVEATDATTVATQIANRILEADSIDDILGMADSAATGAADILDRPFVILERPVWRKARESYQGVGSSGYFVIMQLGMQDTGEVLPVTTGANNVLAALYAMQTKGMLPNDRVMQFISRTAGSGNEVLWLAKWDQN